MAEKKKAQLDAAPFYLELFLIAILEPKQLNDNFSCDFPAVLPIGFCILVDSPVVRQLISSATVQSFPFAASEGRAFQPFQKFVAIGVLKIASAILDFSLISFRFNFSIRQINLIPQYGRTVTDSAVFHMEGGAVQDRRNCRTMVKWR